VYRTTLLRRHLRLIIAAGRNPPILLPLLLLLLINIIIIFIVLIIIVVIVFNLFVAMDIIAFRGQCKSALQCPEPRVTDEAASASVAPACLARQYHSGHSGSVGCLI
jgi:fatty acid desaturase